jgi:hypothetical protein
MVVWHGVLSMAKPARVYCVVLLALLAASAARAKVDCEASYKSAMTKLLQMQLSPERTVVLIRRALRIYDACQTGDFENAVFFFENLDRLKN